VKLTPRLVVLAAMSVGAVAPASAQVGYEPRKSPYHDLEHTQELTFYSGWYRAKKDPARVAPRSGPLAGVLYQWRTSGPANITAGFGRVESERTVLDPEKSGKCPAVSRDCKIVSNYRWPVYLVDFGLGMSLTGGRSFYRLVPQANLGAGIATDFHTKPDIGDFAFGTRFALTWGAGIRWVPGGAYQIRADVLNHLYSVKYPGTYYQAAPDTTVIFTNRQSRTAWLNNPSFTLGISYLFSK
jgi:hypothetical protein